MRTLLALLTLTFTLSGCTQQEASPLGPARPEAGKQTWDNVGTLPLSKRMGPVVVWTGHEILVVGGDVGDPCPPNASCATATEAAADGAAYDPLTRSWRPIAPAPVTLPAYHHGVHLDGHLLVPVGDRLHDYDVAADHWRTDAQPITPWAAPVADGDRLILVPSSDEEGEHPDQVYDVRTGRWSTLPDDPLPPSYHRVITSIPTGLVLTARSIASVSEENAPTSAAVLDRSTGAWRRLPDGTGVGGSWWAWTGSRMVDATTNYSQSAERSGTYDEVVAVGGSLDPATGIWSSLADPPDEDLGWQVWALKGPAVATSGWIYDDSANEPWRRVPRPKGAGENPGPAVWADGTLYVIGSQPQAVRHASEYDQSVWSWRVPTG